MRDTPRWYGWKMGKGLVEAWWETINGGDGSRPVSPLGRARQR